MLRRMIAALLLSPAAAAAQFTPANQTNPAGIYEVPIEPMKTFESVTSNSLAPFKGKVLLLVNVASKCGFTSQYEGLEALQDKYGPQGLQVIGLPSNDFMGQEPGTEEEIVQFCRTKFDVSFPLYAKLHAKGDNISPIYKYLTDPATSPFPGAISWNFNKFLIGRDGHILARFGSREKPDSPEIIAAIEKALAAKPAGQ
ncbi:MAG: glutathione peroxidase [Candidatus Sumerlaeaceae bacterium]|nr:glutathione peroxidase [Candidatus Sumerlaeaceae bacterium]